jgi:hypothetical protein
MIEMLLMLLVMAVLGVTSVAITVRLLLRDDPAGREAVQPKAAPRIAPRFFVDGPPRPQVPIEAMLVRVERHIRLEQAAALAFLDSPTPQSLHRPTASPLVQ